MNIPSEVKSAEIRAVVIRADGTARDLGVVSYYHRSPILRFLHWVKRKLWLQ